MTELKKHSEAYRELLNDPEFFAEMQRTWATSPYNRFRAATDEELDAIENAPLLMWQVFVIGVFLGVGLTLFVLALEAL